MQPDYEQVQGTLPTTLKNLVSAYIIVNELRLVVPAGVLAADYRIYRRTGDIDIAWLGKWFAQQHRQPGQYNSKNTCSFVKASQVPCANAKIKFGGPNSIAVQYLAEVIIEDLVITKCRHEPPAQLNAETLLAAWDTYCYFTETDQLGMLITAHLLGADDIVMYSVNRVRGCA